MSDIISWFGRKFSIQFRAEPFWFNKRRICSYCLSRSFNSCSIYFFSSASVPRLTLIFVFVCSPSEICALRLVRFDAKHVAEIFKYTSFQKNLGLFLDDQLNFTIHLKEKMKKLNKGIGVLEKLQHVLLRKTLLTIHKSFIWPYLHYKDIIFGQPNNESFGKKIESYQYNTALAITGASDLS